MAHCDEINPPILWDKKSAANNTGGCSDAAVARDLQAKEEKQAKDEAKARKKLPQVRSSNKRSAAAREGVVHGEAVRGERLGAAEQEERACAASSATAGLGREVFKGERGRVADRYNASGLGSTRNSRRPGVSPPLRLDPSTPHRDCRRLRPGPANVLAPTQRVIPPGAVSSCSSKLISN